MPPLIVNNPLPRRALRRANANPPLNYYQNNNLRPALTRTKSRINLFNQTSRGSLTTTVPLDQNNNLRPALTRNKSRRNLFNRTSRGSLTKTMPLVRKTTMFSNGSKPGNNINNSLPKSTLSNTSNKTFGASVVPPTNIANTYSSSNYNRSYSSVKRKNRKTRRKNYN